MPDIQLTINGETVTVPSGTIVAAALAITNTYTTRRSIHGQPRGPLCGMGICYECRVTINDQPHRLSCQTICESGMKVLTI